VVGLLVAIALVTVTVTVAAPDALPRASAYVSVWLTKDVGAPSNRVAPRPFPTDRLGQRATG